MTKPEHKMTWGWTSKPATLLEVRSCVGPGWGAIIESLVTDLFALGWDGQVLQVKEKFGGLRFYIDLGTQEIHERIHKAEDESFQVCEECGAAGTPEANSRGWVKTLCPAHRTGERS